jgi:hypothetical protein
LEEMALIAQEEAVLEAAFQKMLRAHILVSQAARPEECSL